MFDDDDQFAAEVTVRRRRFANADTGFAVLECEADEEEVVLVGPVAHLDEEDRAFVLGAWESRTRRRAAGSSGARCSTRR